ncbi:hypothetical protein GCM10010965_29820 [Caldalkalibacillus thermarum]|uniref:TadE/TadG family type IV pilus assembly protein n=1 Tax=Caldalkalibacillus thermarum TaxID=296745 RepID=UPI0016691E6F|nr:TadE/TadG family type IV pilus assembly protein [Caldalkalibacillus thermarum]GGK34924.1 hypothetical protein GCM10010965_29820 [Caldalkalibacillus thermarum]
MCPNIKNNRGQAFVEFALILPVFLFLIVVGLILALAINAKVTVSHASHEAGRVAAVTTEEETIRMIAERRVIEGGLMYNYENLKTFDPKSDILITRNRDGTVTVTVNYRQPTVVPMIGSLLGNPDFWGTYIPIRSSATFLDETRLGDG